MVDNDQDVAAACRIEGYAIVSEDGMLANDQGVMPESLKIDADRVFFEQALDSIDVVVHGAHSNEQQPHSARRRRLVVTRRVAAIAIDPANAKALLWNPAGASFDQALAAIGTPNGRVAIVGGPEVFGMFLDRYDYFHLSRVPHVRLPGGRPVFPGVPVQTPEELLVGHGLEAGPRDVLDAAKGVTLVHWQRVALA